MSFRSLLGSAISSYGTYLGLPEMGISEAVGRAPTPSQQKQLAWTPGPLPTSYSPAPTSQTTTPQPSPDGGGGGTPQPQPSPTPQPSYDPGAEAARKAEEERSAKEAYEAKMRGEISSAYEPIFANLDKQIGLLPEQRKELESGITSLSGAQKEGVGIQEEAGVRRLGAAGEEEKGLAKTSLMDLEQDIRNQIKGWNTYLGGRGAADSSAPMMASEAVTKGGLKARSTILAARNKGLNAIKLKVEDVHSLAATESNKIDQWKSTKLSDISSWAVDRLNSLDTEKANADAQKRTAIVQLIADTHTDFTNRLRKLDDDVSDYKQSVSTWEMQRAGELEDYGKKLSMASKYESTAGPSYKDARTMFTQLYGTQGINMNTARQSVIDQYGIDPLAGAELSPEEEEQKKQPLDLLNLVETLQQQQ